MKIQMFSKEFMKKYLTSYHLLIVTEREKIVIEEGRMNRPAAPFGDDFRFNEVAIFIDSDKKIIFLRFYSEEEDEQETEFEIYGELENIRFLSKEEEF